MQLLEVAGAVISLTHSQKRALDLVVAGSVAVEATRFDQTQMLEAPVGRVDAFGVGKLPTAEVASATATP
jgi:hypothetical protein